ncbi:hypothetical protein C8J57DRAFT_1500133 [Mycena rebaudengoi]|nr:hypothetical protein C8J57DRAFT_1500133 [Mycena rebaudengoi]
MSHPLLAPPRPTFASPPTFLLHHSRFEAPMRSSCFAPRMGSPATNLPRPTLSTATLLQLARRPSPTIVAGPSAPSADSPTDLAPHENTLSTKAVPAMSSRRTDAQKSYAHTSVRDPGRTPIAAACLPLPGRPHGSSPLRLTPFFPARRRPPTASTRVERSPFVCGNQGQATGRIDDSLRRPKDAMRPNTLAGNAHRLLSPTPTLPRRYKNRADTCGYAERREHQARGQHKRASRHAGWVDSREDG